MTDLSAPPSPIPLPAPLGVLYVLKTVGFILHVIPMNLWCAGVPLAVALWVTGQRSADAWPRRFLAQVPFFLAFGINAGIVPLLFTQVVYHHVFYPATILMAWFWFAVIPLLLTAYVASYRVADEVRSDQARPARLVLWSVIAWVCLWCIGFLFANAFSLMVRPDRWAHLAEQHGSSGAVFGTALNTADPAMWARWLVMLALALTTTAWHPIADRLLRRQEPNDRGELSIATVTYLAGAMFFAVAGTWYAFGTWPPAVREQMLAIPLLPLTVATALAPAVPAGIVLWMRFLSGDARKLAWVGIAAQAAVVALNAISRQVVQHLELSAFGLIRPRPIAFELWPVAVFLLAALIGGSVVVVFLRMAYTSWSAAGSMTAEGSVDTAG